MKSAFKQTELGKIPKDWKVMQMGEIIALKNGEKPIIDNDGSIPVYGANGIMGYTINVLVDNDYTIIIGRVGASGEIHLAQGKTWISDNAIYSDTYEKTNIHLPFLFYLLKYNNLKRFASKTTHPIITQSFLKNYELLLPFFPEQRKIAEILSTVDEAIEKVDKAIEKTERLKKGLMQELLTKGIGHKEFKDTEIGRIPKEWQVEHLSNVTVINKEAKDLPRDYPNSRFFYIDIDSIENNTGNIKKLKEITGKNAPSRARRVVHCDDVIMSTVRPYLKAFAIIPEKYDNSICSTGFAVFTSKENLNSQFLLYSLFSKVVIDQCNKMMVGGQYPALNTQQVSRIVIPVPLKAEQRAIAQILRNFDERLGQIRRKKDELTKIKQGLMSDLLTGRKRVKL